MAEQKCIRNRRVNNRVFSTAFMLVAAVQDAFARALINGYSSKYDTVIVHCLTLFYWLSKTVNIKYSGF